MKEFKTYEEQIELLKIRGLKFENEEFALNKLQEDNYYSIINGYKDLFLDKEDSNKFKNNVTFFVFYKL